MVSRSCSTEGENETRRTYTSGGSEGAINVKETDGVENGTFVQWRVETCCFCHDAWRYGSQRRLNRLNKVGWLLRCTKQFIQTLDIDT